MASVELPEKAAALLREIRKKNYKVGFEKFAVRDTSIQLLMVQDLESALKGKDPFKDVSTFPFWIKLWESAMILADVVGTLQPETGSRMLELGAGLGAPGLVAAARGFDVTLSDNEKLCLDFQRVSAAANQIKVDCRYVDWKKPPAMEPFDTIIGADILYRDELIEPLLALFIKYLKPGGSIYLSHNVKRETLYKLLDKAQADFKVMAKKIDITDQENSVTVMLNCLKRK